MELQYLCSEGTEEMWTEEGSAHIAGIEAVSVTLLLSMLMCSFAGLQNSGYERKQNLIHSHVLCFLSSAL